MIMMIMMIMMMMRYDGIHDTLDYFTTWRFVKGQENKSLCCTNNFRAEQLKDHREDSDAHYSTGSSHKFQSLTRPRKVPVI